MRVHLREVARPVVDGVDEVSVTQRLGGFMYTVGKGGDALGVDEVKVVLWANRIVSLRSCILLQKQRDKDVVVCRALGQVQSCSRSSTSNLTCFIFIFISLVYASRWWLPGRAFLAYIWNNPKIQRITRELEFSCNFV